jgi:addiction module HigA family antidote
VRETRERLWPDVAVPPGETLAETLEVRGMSQAELARRMGRPVQAINEIVRGGKALTAETALQLEKVLGTPAHVWTRLEADYRFNLARLAQRDGLKEQVADASRYPYSSMAELGWVERTRSATRRVEELQRFFGVATLRQVPQLVGVAFRRSRKVKSSAEALAAWLRQGDREAEAIRTGPFDAEQLRHHLGEVRAMTLQDPEDFEPRLRDLLASVGVTLVLVPHLPKTGASGATRWQGRKAIVQLSLRYKWEDVFWFSLFHELGHVLLHPRGEVFIRWESDGGDAKEREADGFASCQLIPQAEYERFVAKGQAGHFPEVTVRAFARQQGIAPSVVVGRLQHERLVPHSHLNGLRRRFEWADRGRAN